MSTEFFRQLTNLYLLVRVVEAESFSTAALKLSTTRSLVSRHILALEKALGTRLILRDAKHFALTRAGEEVYQRAILMCDAARDAFEASRGIAAGAQPLRIHSDDCLQRLCVQLVKEFTEGHPHTRFELRSDHPPRTPLQQACDVMLVLGSRAPQPDGWTTQCVGLARTVAVASPQLLVRLQRWQRPGDIEGRHRILYTGNGAGPEWTLEGTGPRARRRGHVYLETDRLDAALDAARLGCGVTRLPLFACRAALDAGELREVFSGTGPGYLPWFACTPQPATTSRTAAAFVEFLAGRVTALEGLGLRAADNVRNARADFELADTDVAPPAPDRVTLVDHAANAQ
ncbi:MAG TPA: LysR family transcriptional regulator [Nevskiaceae bacterium]|nr:LysR family transcriptional regulator [Nevskiaceae bacterium]